MGSQKEGGAIDHSNMVLDANGKQIFTVWKGRRGQEETEKLTQLLTAAPDMQKALNEAHKLIKYLENKYITMEKKDDSAATYTVNVLGEIEDAIKKAEYGK